MIVLDEQLLRSDLERTISRWYRGSVCHITNLRPGTVIKDDAVPAILRKQSQPTFITINERDFWRSVNIDERFCVVCFAWPLSKVKLIPDSLRQLLKLPEFATKRARMGKVIRVTNATIAFYTHFDEKIVLISS